MSKRSLQPSILVIEDEETIASVVKYNLKKDNYNVDVITDGLEGLEFAISNKPDLILLDWMLPSMSGIDICKALRDNESTANIPIIMLTAKGSEMDKVTGLDKGADDYMIKPFSPNELSSRIKAVLRRIRPVFSGKVLTFEDVVLDPETLIVSRAGTELELSPIEFKLLQIFIENPSKVFSRETLIDKIWGNGIYVGSRTIDVHITRLRKILVDASPNRIDLIKTVRMAGYTMRLNGEKPEKEKK